MGQAVVGPCKASSSLALQSDGPKNDYIPFCQCFDTKSASEATTDVYDLEARHSLQAPVIFSLEIPEEMEKAPCIANTSRLRNTASEVLNSVPSRMRRAGTDVTWSSITFSHGSTDIVDDVAERAKSRDPDETDVPLTWDEAEILAATFPTDRRSLPNSRGSSLSSLMRTMSDSVPWGRTKKVDHALPSSVKVKSANGNRPEDYTWLEGVLIKLSQNEAATLECRNNDTGHAFTPIFFLIGACPNMLCSMQAVMYCSARSSGKVDFWWVKPRKSSGGPARLEEATLVRHSHGRFKNDPGRSKQFLQPLADVFESGEFRQGWRFGTELIDTNGKQATRAFMQEQVKHAPKLWVHVLWQEDWSCPPIGRKYIKGKIVYQKRMTAPQFFSRQYEYSDGVMTIAQFEEPPHFTPLPPDQVKQMWDLAAISTTQ